MDADRRLEENRQSWNAATLAHHRHHADLAGYLRRGGSTLFPEERALLGDLHGLRVAHLQCNSGQDSLSLARLGARVTGVDLSDTAITLAEQLSSASGIPAEFVRAEVLTWLDAAARAGERFDVVFCSYGVVCWIDDLARWARGIAGVLAPGGRFAIVEFHPLAAMLDADWRLAFDYGGGRARSQPDGVGDYVGDSVGGLTPAGVVADEREFRNPHACHLVLWGLGEIVSALAGAGLTIETLREYPWSNGERGFTRMRAAADRRMLPPADVPAIPLLFGLSARRLG